MPLLALLILVFTPGRLPAPVDAFSGIEARVDPIFRHVTIGPGYPILLGVAIPRSAASLLKSTGLDTYSVRSGQFSGAMEIEVHTTAEGRVRAIAFSYPPEGEGFAAMLAEYEATLGAPEMTSGEGWRRAVWEDARTRFEITERDGRVAALLSDRELEDGGRGSM